MGVWSSRTGGQSISPDGWLERADDWMGEEDFTDRARQIFDKCQARMRYSFVDIMYVFDTYFREYERHLGYAHPRINSNQMYSIMVRMPFFFTPTSDKLKKGDIEIAPEEYEPIIIKHFDTEYSGCDYNINHFFSGRIRKHRYNDVFNDGL